MDIDKFDITVSDISFVVYRQSNKNWSRINIVNEKNFLLVYAWDGMVTYEVNGAYYDISKGDMLFFDKGQTHSGIANQEHPWTYSTVAFDAENFDPQKFSLLTHTTNIEFYKQLYKSLNYEWSVKNPGYRLMCRGIVSKLICALIRENKVEYKKSNEIEKIKHHITENFTKNYTVDTLASMAGISVSHFHRLFKESAGLSVKRYINNIRINKACDLLKSGEHNITEVAYAVGFHDIYYFSRLFKKLIGVPPSKYIPKRNSLP